MKTIKINYADFGSHFNPEKNWLTNLLRTKYKVIISDNPDYLFYATGGQDHHKYDCIRIFYTGENLIPNFNYCDYALGFHRLNFGDRYFRYPLWAQTMDKIPPLKLSDKKALNRNFCACVIGNSKQTDGVRLQFFNKLNKYKKIASGGRWNNNVGGPVDNKINFQRQYKFTMAFENTSTEGYSTEKIMDAFFSHSLPIYYGDPSITQDFNPEAFINAHDFKSLDELVAYVKKVDQDDKLYLKMLHAPIFRDHTLKTYSKKSLLKFLSPIFDAPYEQAKRRSYFKPYQDIDYIHIKFRDLKQILTYQFSKFFKKGK